LEKHFTLSHSFQVNTEQAHLGAMTMQELAMIKNVSTDFEKIRSTGD
jgi:division protein CdvB (Snf7/Vps24/ESCRT-III family)